jgi:hypothetical protein
MTRSQHGVIRPDKGNVRIAPPNGASGTGNMIRGKPTTKIYPKIFEISLISTGPLSDALVVEASAKEEEDRWKISSGSLAAC